MCQFVDWWAAGPEKYPKKESRHDIGISSAGFILTNASRVVRRKRRATV